MNVFNDLGIEIEIVDQDAGFLKIKETLSRIGILSKKDNTLYQSCHILHKKSKYAIFHFKQLFQLDGKDTDFSESDLARLNTIVKLLVDWNLVKLTDEKQVLEPSVAVNQIKILSFKEKDNYKLVAKYSIGTKH